MIEKIQNSFSKDKQESNWALTARLSQAFATGQDRRVVSHPAWTTNGKWGLQTSWRMPENP